MDVFDFAMKMETDGKAFYEKLAAESQLEGLRTIFTRLAADEQKHYEVFHDLKERKGTGKMENSTALEDARNVFEEIVAHQDEQSHIQGDLEGYRYAMKIEADSVKLYEEAAGREEDETTRQLLLRIAEEEKKHFDIIQNIYDFVNAPNQYLAWREFSNREEFRQFGRDVDL